MLVWNGFEPPFWIKPIIFSLHSKILDLTDSENGIGISLYILNQKIRNQSLFKSVNRFQINVGISIENIKRIVQTANQ